MKRGVSAGFVIIGSILLAALLLSGCSNNAITGNTIVAPERVVFSAEKTGCNYKLLDNSVTLENVTLAKALGSSMRPSIETGDTMLIKLYTKDTPLREGMIVSYTQDEKELVHRIDALYADYFTAKGDNADLTEDVPYSAIDGVVVGVLFNK